MNRTAKIVGEIIIIAAIFMIMAIEAISLLIQYVVPPGIYALIWSPILNHIQLLIASSLFIWKAQRFAKTCIYTKIAAWTMLPIFGLSILYIALKHFIGIDIGLIEIVRKCLLIGALSMLAVPIFKLIKKHLS